MKKFDRRREEAQRKFEEDMRAIEELEQKELRKRIDPIVAKMALVAKEETQRILEANPDVLDEISFKKRDAAKFMKEMLEAYFATDDQPADAGSERAPEAAAEKPSSESELDTLPMTSDEGVNALDEFGDDDDGTTADEPTALPRAPLNF